MENESSHLAAFTLTRFKNMLKDTFLVKGFVMDVVISEFYPGEEVIFSNQPVNKSGFRLEQFFLRLISIFF